MLKKHFNSLPCQMYQSYERQIPFRFWRLAIKYIFRIHNIKSCHAFFNDELVLQAAFTNKTYFTPLILAYYPHIFHVTGLYNPTFQLLKHLKLKPHPEVFYFCRSERCTSYHTEQNRFLSPSSPDVLSSHFCL